MPRLEFEATYENGDDATEDLLCFAEIIGLESVAGDRYSFLLLLQLFGAAKSGFLNPAKVLSQIRALEGLGSSGGMKSATQFKHHPLKGLWHQHYLEDGVACISKNLLKGLDWFGIPYFKERISEAESAGEVRYVTGEDVAHIARDVVELNWKRLRERDGITGEWLIFSKYEGKNYYLCIGAHDSGDDNLRSQIDAVCLQEFPFLQGILSQR